MDAANLITSGGEPLSWFSAVEDAVSSSNSAWVGEIKNDYHIFLVPLGRTTNEEPIQLQVLNVEHIDESSLEEIKSLIKESIASA